MASGDLVTAETGKAEAFMPFFASVLTNKVSQTSEGQVGGGGEQPAVGEDQVRVCLKEHPAHGTQQAPPQSAEGGGCCPHRAALVMLESLWGSGHTPATGETQTLCPSPEKDQRTIQDTAAQSVSGQCPGKSWSEFPWSTFVDTGGRRELGAGSSLD